MSHNATPNTSRVELRKTLTLIPVVMMGLAYMQPMTLFDTFGIVSGLTDGHVPTAYGFALIAILFTALSYGKLVRRYPSVGSAYTYAQKSISPTVGFMVGWSSLLDYLFLPMINYLLIGLFLNIAFPMVPAWVFVLAAIGLVTVLNVIGISSVAGMSNVIVGAQFVFAVVFVAMAVKHLAGIPSLDLSLPFVGDGSQPLISVYRGAGDADALDHDLHEEGHIGDDGIRSQRRLAAIVGQRDVVDDR